MVPKATKGTNPTPERVEFSTIIVNCGGQVMLATARERWNWQQQWREVYASVLHQATGHWTLSGYEWHVFSFRYAKALNGDRAVEEFLAQQPKEFVVVPESPRLDAVRVSGGKLPDLRPIRNDIHIWPADLNWTMAFTHEESIGLGPYFSRREWVAQTRPRNRTSRR